LFIFNYYFLGATTPANFNTVGDLSAEVKTVTVLVKGPVARALKVALM
jgi:hypothetical protein